MSCLFIWCPPKWMVPRVEYLQVSAYSILLLNPMDTSSPLWNVWSQGTHIGGGEGVCKPALVLLERLWDGVESPPRRVRFAGLAVRNDFFGLNEKSRLRKWVKPSLTLTFNLPRSTII